MVDQSEGLVGAQLGGGEDDGVEGHIILGHKLVVGHLIPVLPPALPLVRVGRRDAQIADRSVEPHVKHLKEAETEPSATRYHSLHCDS